MNLSRNEIHCVFLFYLFKYLVKERERRGGSSRKSSNTSNISSSISRGCVGGNNKNWEGVESACIKTASICRVKAHLHRGPFCLIVFSFSVRWRESVAEVVVRISQ